MTHIQTTSDAEKSMRELYKEATDQTPARAGTEQIESVKKILDLNREADLLRVQISQEIGKLMGFMQGHASLVNDQGKMLASWRNFSDVKRVDIDGLIADQNIPPSVVSRFTKTSRGPRVFKVED